MKSKNLFAIYIMLGMIAVIATQALPVVYESYGLTNNQIYNLISIVFLATAFQPILGFIIDKFFSQERGISLLFALVGVMSICLIFVQSYPFILFVILIFSIFRLPLFPIIDGYTAGVSSKLKLNMGSIRAGSTIGYGIGMTILMLFLNVFGLRSNFTFLFIAIVSFIAVGTIELTARYSEEDKKSIATNSSENVDADNSTKMKTKWDMVILLAFIQIGFFGFSILKVNYTTPFLVEHGYSNGFIAATTIAALFPLFILMPLFNTLFSKFKYTTLIYAATFISIFQVGLFLLFPENVIAVMFGSFLIGFIFPIYTPVFGLFLRKGLNAKYISTGFTTIFTIQNLFVFFFNQFIVINVLNTTNTVNSAYFICFVFFVLALVPTTILRFKKY